jgi:hypothetical protein
VALINDDEVEGLRRDVEVVGDEAVDIVGGPLEATALVVRVVEGLAAQYGIERCTVEMTTLAAGSIALPWRCWTVNSSRNSRPAPLGA